MLAVKLSPHLEKLTRQCPAIYRQFIYSDKEAKEAKEGLVDPLIEEEYTAVKGMVHKYGNRALILLTMNCSAYCRFCTRRRSVSDIKKGIITVKDINNMAKYLKKHSEIKEIIFSGGDPMTVPKILKIADTLGPYICVLKTHIDIIEDFDIEIITELQRLAEKHNFLIFEDRKFADIGNTVKYQYQNGIFNIADWADIVNCHILAGPGTIEGLQEVGLHKGRGLLILAQMSSKENLLNKEYALKAVEMAKKYSDFCIGFIAQEKLIDDENFITMTPGVKLEKQAGTLGQQYNTPEYLIKEKGTDIIIVGKGIYEAENPVEEAKKYQKAGWSSLKS